MRSDTEPSPPGNAPAPNHLFSRFRIPKLLSLLSVISHPCACIPPKLSADSIVTNVPLSVQGEWVLLMRELEHALAPASERSRLASAQDSGMTSSPPGTPSNLNGQSRLLDNIEAWRLDIETATAAERPQSVCSALTDNSGIGRAASLASIYSGNPSDYQSDVDEFFSDCEHDESTIWPATKVEIPHQMLAVA